MSLRSAASGGGKTVCRSAVASSLLVVASPWCPFKVGRHAEDMFAVALVVYLLACHTDCSVASSTQVFQCGVFVI